MHLKLKNFNGTFELVRKLNVETLCYNYTRWYYLLALLGY